MKNRFKIFTIILSAVACFGLFSRAEAADGDALNGNTVEGFNALGNAPEGGPSAGAFNAALWRGLGTGAQPAVRSGQDLRDRSRAIMASEPAPCASVPR